jgi:hypothetical protein
VAVGPGAPGLEAPAPRAGSRRLPRDRAARRPLADKLAESLSARGLLIGAVFILLTWLVVRPVQDPDFWWHVTAGRWMLEHSSLPGKDLFTYTVPSQPWVDHEYLTEIGLYATQQAFGLVGVSLLFGAMTWLAIWLIDRRSQLEPQPYVIRALILALAAVAGSPFWGPRAQMITFLFVCVELYWLDRFLRGGDRQIYLLPLLIVVWANLHGGFLVAFLFLAIALLARLAGAAMARSRELVRDASILAMVGAACAVGSLLTPYTYRLLGSVAEPQASPLQQSLIVEWLSPDFHVLAFRPFEAMVLGLVAGFALGRPKLYEVVLALATLALALQSARHIPIFVAACTPILVRLYGELWRRWSAERGWALPSTSPSPRLAAVTVIALLGLAALVGVAAQRRLAEQEVLTQSTYPVAASDWLAAHPEVGTRMFNSYGWGGYLVYRFYPQPQRRVFVFGEATLMGDDQLKRYADVEGIRPDWQNQLEAAGVDYVVFGRSAPLTDALAVDPGWRKVYEDRVTAIYVRSRVQQGGIEPADRSNRQRYSSTG